MKFTIYMIYRNTLGSDRVPMPHDNGLDIYEAVFRANLYKKRCPHNDYQVVNEANGDIEYEAV